MLTQASVNSTKEAQVLGDINPESSELHLKYYQSSVSFISTMEKDERGNKCHAVSGILRVIAQIRYTVHG